MTPLFETLEISTANFIQWILLLPFILMLIFSFNKAKENGREFVKTEKIIFLVTSLVVLISSIVVIGYLVLRLNSVLNLGLKKEVQTKIPYKIYTITKSELPKGFFYSTDLNTDSTLDRMKVKSVKMTIVNQDRGINIYQTQIESNFNLESYLKTYFNNTTLTKIDIINAKDGKGFYITNRISSLLYFITSDNVLIKITSFNNPLEFVTYIAESLKQSN